MKKIIIITISISLLVVIGQNVQAAELLLDYPTIPGAGKLGEGEASTLPGIIRYIYLFSLGIVGFIALLSILIGAIKYTTAAGNVSQVEDAKKQIKEALLGILILLAAVLILNIINPDLINIGFKLPEIKTTLKGCFAKNECLNKCKSICKKPENALCTIVLDTETCPENQSACYCQE